MIPLKLSVRNFLCYRDNVPPLDLQGIHVACLCGPNGHGKSALLDAMTWCLWGQARTGGRNYDSLIAHGETECRVELDFLARGQRHRAIRRRRNVGQGRTELDLFVLDDADEPRAITGNMVRETELRIRNLVGMDYATFVNSAFLTQGRSDEFTRKTPADRKAVLSSILGLEVYETLQDAARNRRSEWQQISTREEGALAHARSALEQLADPTGELSEIAERLERLSTELTDSATEARSRQDLLEDLQRKQTQLTTLEANISKLRQNLDREESSLNDIRERLRSAHQLVERAHDINAGATQLAEARANLDRLESVRRQHGTLQERRNGLQAAIKLAHSTLSSDVAELERRISQDLEPVAKQSEQIERELAALDDADRSINDEQSAIDSQTEELGNLSAAIAGNSSELERCVAEGKELRQKQQALSGAHGPDALCPLCRTPLSEDACANISDWYASEIEAKLEQHRNLNGELKTLAQRKERLAAEAQQRSESLAQRQREVQQQRGRLEQTRRQCDAAHESLAELKPRLAGLQAKLKAEEIAESQRSELLVVDAELALLDYDDTSHRAAYQLCQSLQGWDAEKMALDNALARQPLDESELRLGEERTARLRENLAEAENSLLEDRAALAELPEFQRAAAEAEAALRRLAEERDQLLARQGRLQSDQERRQRYQAEIEGLEKSHAEAQVEQGVYSELFEAFGRSGAPAMLIDAAVPRLESETNHLLGRMTDNRMAVKLETQRITQGGSVSETLDIMISDELGTRNYELFSGGEAFRINLALRIALSKVLSQRLGAPLPTLFIDEGFGTQDAAGRERIVDAIASIQDEFEKIIVITHLDDLKDLFPTRIEVLKTDAGSQCWLS